MITKIKLKLIVLVSLFFGMTYLIIWIVFTTNGPFQLGESLNKSDWLIFTGGYLSFVGTISITYMVIIQNKNSHDTELEKLRYSQLPYIRIKHAKAKEELQPSSNGYYILDFPVLFFENSKFIWKGGQTGSGVMFPASESELLALFNIKNIGLGHAMKISLHSLDSDYNCRTHLKINESLYFIVDIASLKKETQEIILYVKFCDVYNNKYQQKLSCEFVIEGTIFHFTVNQEQFEPELIKT